MPRKSQFPDCYTEQLSLAVQILKKAELYAKQDQNKIALLNAENPKQHITYGDLCANINTLSAFLHKIGFRSGDTAAAISANCWQFPLAFTAVTLCGGAFSGVSYVFTPDEAGEQCRDCNASVIFCSSECLELTRKLAIRCPRVKYIIILDEISSQTSINANEILLANILNHVTIFSDFIEFDVKKQVLLLPYSSGTTGKPKGVMISHHNMSSMISMYNSYYNVHVWPKIDPNFAANKENLLVTVPLYHLYGMFLVIQGLLNGMTLILVKKFEERLFCQLIQDYKVRLLFLVPPMMLFLSKSPIVSEYDLQSINYILCGAAPMGAEVSVAVRTRIPSIRYIVQGYGMTETSVASHFPVLSEFNPNYATVGKLAPNMEEKIVDETDKEVGPNVRGEICVRGPNIMLGYLNRPEATKSTIDAEGWLHTGDVGYFDEDGCLYIVDRLKELIKVRGLQVAPAELEDVILTNPLVADCAVIGVKDTKSGELPKAFIVRRDKKLTAENIKKYVSDRVAYYKRLNGGVEFVEKIPKSPSGKILRRELRAPSSKI